MSQTKYKMDNSTRELCRLLVSDYRGMVKRYNQRREAVIHGSPPPPDGMPRGTTTGDSTATKAEQLDRIEMLHDTHVMRVIEAAQLHIGMDIANDSERGKLRRTIIDSCVMGRRFRLRYYDICVGRSDFYERRRAFLHEIATELGMI